jgi:butyryl-CoA dehydrogenase
MTLRTTVDFLLYEWLHTEGLQTRERFADHSRETFDAVLDTCERIAREKYAPFNRTVDVQEPVFDGEKVILPACTQDALDAYAASGMLSAAPPGGRHRAGMASMLLALTLAAVAGRLVRC